MQKRLSHLFAASALCLGMFAAGLRAQNTASTIAKPEAPAPGDDDWHVDVVPYLWFAGVHGTSGVLGHDASIHADASEVLSNFNIGFMGALEARYNRILIPVDFMWIKLTDNGSTRIPGQPEMAAARWISIYVGQLPASQHLRL